MRLRSGFEREFHLISRKASLFGAWNAEPGCEGQAPDFGYAQIGLT